MSERETTLLFLQRTTKLLIKKSNLANVSMKRRSRFQLSMMRNGTQTLSSGLSSMIQPRPSRATMTDYQAMTPSAKSLFWTRTSQEPSNSATLTSASPKEPPRLKLMSKESTVAMETSDA